MLHEAFAEIEAKAAELDLPPWMGEELMPVEKLSMVSRFHGGVGKKLDEAVLRFEIQPEFYRDCWLRLIDEYARHLVRVRMEMLLMGGA